MGTQYDRQTEWDAHGLENMLNDGCYRGAGAIDLHPGACIRRTECYNARATAHGGAPCS